MRGQVSRREAARREARRVLRVWHFGNAALDESTFELSVAGQRVVLERKHSELLMYLVQHAGEVLLKDPLVAAIWPARPVSDAGLARCIATLRDALGDQGQALIKDTPGGGYRFTPAVHVESALPADTLPDSITEVARRLR